MDKCIEQLRDRLKQSHAAIDEITPIGEEMEKWLVNCNYFFLLFTKLQIWIYYVLLSLQKRKGS